MQQRAIQVYIYPQEDNIYEQGLISSCGQVNAVLPIIFVSSYTYIITLEQIQMQLLLNCHLVTFL